MRQKSTRRGFLQQLSAGATALAGLHAGARAPLFAQVTTGKWKGLPRLDGVLVFDDALCEQMAMDLGGHSHRVPAAVLRPRSAKDVLKIVRFAHTHRLKVAMRGRGHSQYGQTLVEGGIVVDSSTLSAVKLTGPRTVDAQAGASWNAVTRATLAHGLTPPAMGDTMTLSVGGILSAGGVSNSSHLFGAVVDNVEELDVVTGSGELVTCSPQRNSKLFDLALAGMGQCGLLVGARLRLTVAPRWVVRRDLDYDDLKTFLVDVRRLATEARAEHLGAYVLPRDEKGGWRFRINIGKFCASPHEADFPELEAGLHFKAHSDPVAVSYADYLQREVVRNATTSAARRQTPSRLLYVAMFVPASASEDFVARILATPSETAGMTRFSLYVLPTPKFTRAMLMLPREDLALSLWLFRGVPIADESAYSEAVVTVRQLADKMREAGGKAYPPYAPFFSGSDWEGHYGPNQWSRLTAGKKAFDPGGVLTPGTGMFGP